jgi:hypothetical protein
LFLIFSQKEESKIFPDVHHSDFGGMKNFAFREKQNQVILSDIMEFIM